jgi:hypothetical protein
MSALRKAILKSCRFHYCKVAMVISRTSREMGDDRSEFLEDIAAEIAVLVEAGVLHSKGDITQWRRSEVRINPM